MKQIISILNDYHFEATKVNHATILGLHCQNKEANLEFILDYTADNVLKRDELSSWYKQNVNSDIAVKFFVPVNDEIEALLDLIEANPSLADELLIYDDTDEIEFFLKDLWNLIVTLKLSQTKTID